MIQAVGTGKNDREYWAQLMPQAVDEHDLMVSLQTRQHCLSKICM